MWRGRSTSIPRRDCVSCSSNSYIGHYQLVVNMEKVEFLDSTGLGVLVGGLKRVRAHDGSLDLVGTQERILKIFRITGLTKVFGIHDSVDEGDRGPEVREVTPPHADDRRWPRSK